MYSKQHPATLIKRLTPSVLPVSSSTIVPADTAGSAWVRTDLGRGRTVVTLLQMSSLCSAAWWEGHVPCGQMIGNCSEQKKKPPAHDMPPCSTSACPCTGTPPVCTAWAQGQAWAARDWPLLAVPACTWCGVKKHTKWKQGDQNQTLRNGRPSNGPIPTEGTRALTIVQINIENVAKTVVRVQTLSQGHLGGWEN